MHIVRGVSICIIGHTNIRVLRQLEDNNHNHHGAISVPSAAGINIGLKVSLELASLSAVCGS